MIAILSPAMNMKSCALPFHRMTEPMFLDRAHSIAAQIRQHTHWELEGLLRTSPELALLAYSQYQQFGAKGHGSPALLSFHGLAFQHIAPEDFSEQDLSFAQDHVLILSALYGLLRPLDAIMPYRLDFMSRLKMDGKNLYTHWGDLLFRAIYEENEPVLNLCSNEYSKLVRPFLRPYDPFVTCRFLTRRKQKYTCLATDAKMARGEMIRYLVKNRVQSLADVQAFRWDSYAYSEEQSDSQTLTFLRD